MMTRQEAESLLHEWTLSENLRKHAYAVEAAMRAYAGRFGEDEDFWGVVGLLHDLDYEKHPSRDEHPLVGVQVLQEKRFPELALEAIKGHAEYLHVPRTTPMAKALFAVDELVGLITACALVRPSKSVEGMNIKSIKKKWKDKAFAKGVDRRQIEEATADLGVPLDEHLQTVLDAMSSVADRLGLAG
ncbi:MAG: HDIG domain-containing metalloprotein [Nitrospinota bacterium]